MSLFEILTDNKMRQELQYRRYGVVVGVVSNTQDPDQLGRVKVKFPWLADNEESNWARVAVPMAGKGRGVAALPRVDDEVLVAFEHGDPFAPYVLGALWNGKDTLPDEKSGDDKNDVLVIKSKSGHVIVLSDQSGSEKIQITDKTGNNKITIESGSNKLSIEVKGDIELKAPSGKILLDAKSVEIKSSAEAKVQAGSTLDLNASATMTVKGATVNIN